MVHGLAEQSGGRLALKSRKDKGTTAEIWLPVAEADEKAAPEPSKAPMKSSEPASTALTVLAVDDDALVLMNLAALLEDLGHKVIEASSGTEALDLLRQARTVDLVVTDQAMPGMTGVQLASAIKTEWPTMPIILATGYAELPPGADHDLPKLSKPFRQEGLARVIADCMVEARKGERVVPFRGKRG
jgi:CheY-like chemotaxis protein